MKIETENFKIEYEDKFLKCNCGGIILPLITQNYIYGDSQNRKGGSELRWKCSKCSKGTI